MTEVLCEDGFPSFTRQMQTVHRSDLTLETSAADTLSGGADLYTCVSRGVRQFGSRMPRPKQKLKPISPPVDTYVRTLLEKISQGKHVLSLPKGEKIFAQGDRADAIFFIQSGKVKISVVSAAGKEAVLVMLGPHNFFGECSLVGQSLRVSTATTLAPSTVFRVEKSAMLQALYQQAALSEEFIAALLQRNIDLEEDLCDQLFNHSEKRLARSCSAKTRSHARP